MPTTVKYALAYPLGTVAPNVPAVMQTLAESVEAALVALDIEKRPKGLIGNNFNTNFSVGLGGTEVMADLVNVSLVAGRWYEATYRFTTDTSIANMAVSANLKKSATADTTAAGTTITDNYTVYTAPAASQGASSLVVFTWQAATTETVNIKAILTRATGTVTYNINDRHLTVKDIGAQL